MYRTVPTIKVITSSGTWNKPAGCKWIKVIVTGGGGGGASAYYYGSGGWGGNPGYPGGTAIKWLNVININSVTVTIGAAGIGGGNGGGSGTAGGNSSFGSYCTGNGGAGGVYSNIGGYWGNSGTGGDINLYGDGTSNQWREPSTGNVYVAGSARGGQSYWGGNGPGVYGAKCPPAYNWGSSGGGGSYYVGNMYGGGDGVGGVCVVEEYYE